MPRRLFQHAAGANIEMQMVGGIGRFWLADDGNLLAPGHLIEITVKQETFTYRVTESFVVNPEDTWVLKSDKSKNEITLVTCTPIRTATQRLIIKGQSVN